MPADTTYLAAQIRKVGVDRLNQRNSLLHEAAGIAVFRVQDEVFENLQAFSDLSSAFCVRRHAEPFNPRGSEIGIAP